MITDALKVRAAGILMPVQSLPGKFGIGDLGPQAYAFARFLSRSHQRFWQLLPLNPTEPGKGHSPYSAISSMAGNTLLISPEALMKDGLLSKGDLARHAIPAASTIAYNMASSKKAVLFEKAYANFRNGGAAELQQPFREFVSNTPWLHDFALYTELRRQHQEKPWYTWPDPYKLRNTGALEQFADDHTDAIEKTRWLQFIFRKQCAELKVYCNALSVSLFGDLPFYISYDSADVWANPEIFSLDRNGAMLGMAGVPPDYFNKNGQLWGMPVFRWDTLRKQGYNWWVARIRNNMLLYDVLRLDHFRAFAGYWEVPAGHKTAVKGQWRKGPGIDIFKTFEDALGPLPFVAEDLGDVDDAVYQLRDIFNMPGMRVLQFAFGKDSPTSIHSPHCHTPNSIVYTGTHDNNTTRGWYRQETDTRQRKVLSAYAGVRVTEKNVHLVLSRLAYASVANTAILPFQDVAGLTETARINTPATTTKNWLWRARPEAFSPTLQQQLKQWAIQYGRAAIGNSL